MFIALANGSAPLIVSLLILIPLWLLSPGIAMSLPPLYEAIIIALTFSFTWCFLCPYRGCIMIARWFTVSVGNRCAYLSICWG